MSAGVCTIFFGKATKWLKRGPSGRQCTIGSSNPRFSSRSCSSFATAGLASPGFNSPAM